MFKSLEWEHRSRRHGYCSISLGYSQSDSESHNQAQTSSGGPLWSPSGNYRGAAQDQIANLLFPGRGSNASTVFGSRYQQPFTLTDQPRTLNDQGLFQGQADAIPGAFSQAVQQAMSKLSGNFANRGFNTPRSIAAIAGSAAQNVSPQLLSQLLPLMGGQTQEQNTFLQNRGLIPENIAQQRNKEYMDFLTLIGGLLGNVSQGTSEGSSESSSKGGQGSVGSTKA